MWSKYWQQYRKDGAAVVGLVILVLLLLITVFGPYLINTSPTEGSLRLRRAPPSSDAWFGRDALGRDIFARIVYGGRLTIMAGLAATAIGSISGFLIGLTSGFYGSWVGALSMRIVDLWLGFPFFLSAILIIAILGPSLPNAIIAIGVARIPIFARFVRGSALQVREATYVEAARAIGCRNTRIMGRHMVPNIVMPALVLATVQMAVAILSVSGLSFLGLGAQPPTPEWGLMLSEARSYITQAPHIMFFPGLSLSILVLCINLVGDGLQFAADPRMRGR